MSPLPRTTIHRGAAITAAALFSLGALGACGPTADEAASPTAEEKSTTTTEMTSEESMPEESEGSEGSEGSERSEGSATDGSTDESPSGEDDDRPSSETASDGDDAAGSPFVPGTWFLGGDDPAMPPDDLAAHLKSEAERATNPGYVEHVGCDNGIDLERSMHEATCLATNADGDEFRWTVDASPADAEVQFEVTVEQI